MRSLRSPFSPICPSHPLVVVSQGWPNVLISVMAQGILLAGAYFPTKWIKFFRSMENNNFMLPMHPLANLERTSLDQDVVYVVVGNTSFVAKNLKILPIGPKLVALE